MKKNLEVIQEECSDCGICCLSSIIKFYNGDIPLETLRFNTNTDELGCNAYDLINCAKRNGFNSYGKRVEDVANLKPPFIAHMKMENSLFHFVVVYKINSKNLLIMDPSVGFKRMDIAVFNKLFTGVTIHFFPINIIPKYKKNKFIMKKIKKEYNNKTFLIILLLSFIILIFTMIINLQVEILNINKCYIYLFLILILVNELLTILRNNLLINNSIKFNFSIMKEFVIHIFNLPLNYLKLKSNGEIVTRFNELNELSNNIFNIIIDIIFVILLNIIFMILFIIKYKRFVLIFILFTGFYLLFNMKVYKRLVKDIKNSINLEEGYNSKIIDYISNINTIKNINKYDYFINNINVNLLNKNSINKGISKEIFKIDSINNFFLNIIMLLLLYFILVNDMNISNSLLLFILCNYYISNLKKIIDYYPTIILYNTIIRKNSDFLSFKCDKLLPVSNKFNFISIKNLCYEINGNIILNNVNFNIVNKDKILLSGPSGVGKSTLMRIINKEIMDYKGNIIKDNIDLKNYDVSNLITYTSQNEVLFDDSIYNNILLGMDIEEEELNKVIRICRINEINVVRDMGLNTMIINKTCISGGEINRIILARSLIHSKKILILDEVLKEVDYKLEMDILRDLIQEYSDKTIIYISHKNVGKLFSKVLVLGKE